jgi:membrane protein required for colicin V production
VFIFFVLAIHLIGKFIEKISSLLLLGWANHLIGAILYGFISLIVLSSFYWFINNLHIIDAKHFSNSKSYALIAPITPWIMEHMGKIIPWIKPMFTDLQSLITAIPSK